MENSKKLKLPKFSYVFFGIAIFSVILYLIAIFVTPFADFFNRYISSIFRAVFATVTNIFPFSFAELVIITLPISLFFVVRFALKKYSDTWRDVAVFCITVISVLSLLLSHFILSFGIGYYTSRLDKKLDLDKKEVSANELAQTAEWLITEINREIENVEFEEKSSSISPYSVREINNILLESYDKLSDQYDFIPKLTSYVKPIMLSKPMTYTHISGVYTYMTGEANLNTNCPDYCMPHTMAHELAHQRGISREDEANFIAFLVCTSADDPYVRYCGYLKIFEYVSNALYDANTDLWNETYQKLDKRAVYEMIAYNKFYEKYRDNVVGEISGAINDAYLQANGTEGTKSYGLVVDLAVAYYHKYIQN